LEEAEGLVYKNQSHNIVWYHFQGDPYCVVIVLCKVGFAVM